MFSQRKALLAQYVVQRGKNAVNGVWAWSPKAWMLVTTHLAPHPFPFQYVVQRSKNAVNASVLGMVAKGMDACDKVSSSTSLHSTLYKEAKML